MEVAWCKNQAVQSMSAIMNKYIAIFLIPNQAISIINKNKRKSPAIIIISPRIKFTVQKLLNQAQMTIVYLLKSL